jgi:predicted dehydrogenase
VEIAALCDADTARLDRVCAEYPGARGLNSYAELLDEGVDLVVVATPMPAHAEHSIQALEAGVHVLCEVPAVCSLDEAAALAKAVRSAKTQYMLAENCCFWAFVESWTAMTAAGRIGEPMYAEAEYVHDCRGAIRNPDGSPAWRAHLNPIQYCTHSLGPVLQIVGGRCITATGLHTGTRLTPEFGTIDMEVGLFRTDRGVPIRILCAFGVARYPAYHSYTIYGTRGCLERPRHEDQTRAWFDDIPELQGMTTLPLGVRHRSAGQRELAGGHGTAEWAMMRAFLEAIRSGSKVPIGVHAGLDMTVPGICAHLSAERGGQLVEVPDYR